MEIIQTRNAVEVADFFETMVRSMVSNGGNVSEIIVGLINALFHGEILEDAGLHFDDEQLGQIHDFLEAVRGLFDKIEEG